MAICIDLKRHNFEVLDHRSEAAASSAYNGHFGCTCYHPLFVFNQLGDVERCALRSGNVHSADGWRAVLEPVVVRYRGTVKRLYFRGDAAFANPEVYEFLEPEGMGYAIRLPANRGLAGQDRLPAEAPCRATAARGAPLLRELRLSGAKLEESPEGCGKGRSRYTRAFQRLGAVSWRFRPPAAGAARDFAVAQDARRDDSGSLPPGIRGMSVQRHFRELLIEDVGGP